MKKSILLLFLFTFLAFTTYATVVGASSLLSDTPNHSYGHDRSGPSSLLDDSPTHNFRQRLGPPSLLEDSPNHNFEKDSWGGSRSRGGSKDYDFK